MLYPDKRTYLDVMLNLFLLNDTRAIVGPENSSSFKRAINLLREQAGLDPDAIRYAVQLCITSYLMAEDSFNKAAIVLKMWLFDSFPLQEFAIELETSNLASEQGNVTNHAPFGEPDFVSANNDQPKSE